MVWEMAVPGELEHQLSSSPKPAVRPGAGDSDVASSSLSLDPGTTPGAGLASLCRPWPGGCGRGPGRPGTEAAPSLRTCTTGTGPSRPSTATPASSTSRCTATTTATSSRAAGRPTRYPGPWASGALRGGQAGPPGARGQVGGARQKQAAPPGNPEGGLRPESQPVCTSRVHVQKKARDHARPRLGGRHPGWQRAPSPSGSVSVSPRVPCRGQGHPEPRPSPPAL